MTSPNVPERQRLMRRSPLRVVVTFLALLGLIAAGCSDDDDLTVGDPTLEDTTPGANPDEPETTPTVEDATPDPAVTPADEDTTPERGEAARTPAEPTREPTTPDGDEGIDIEVACVDGEPVTTPLPIADLEEIDDVVNTIDFCVGAGGLASVGFTAPCPSGDRDVIVAAVDGALPDIATLDLCETEG